MRYKVITEYIWEHYIFIEDSSAEKGSRESDQNKQTLCFGFATVICGAVFSYDIWWKKYCAKLWHVKGKSRFTIMLPPKLPKFTNMLPEP